VGIGVETLRDAIGRSSANLAVAVIVGLLVGLLALRSLRCCASRAVAASHRDWRPGPAVLGVAWCPPRLGAPVASTARPTFAVREVRRSRRACTLTSPRARDPRDASRDSRRPLLTVWRGKDVLLCSLRATGGCSPGLVLPPRSTRCSTRAPRSCGREVLLAQRLPHLVDVRGSAGCASTLQSGSESAPSGATTNSSRATASPERGVQTRRVAGGRRRPANKRTCRGSSSTTTTRSTTAATSATASRLRLPRARPVRPEPAPPRAPKRTGLRSSLRSTSSRATAGRASPAIPWNEVGDGRSSRVPAEESTRAKLFGDADRAAPPTAIRIEYTMSTSSRSCSATRRQAGGRPPGRPSAPIVTARAHPRRAISSSPTTEVMDQIAGWGCRTACGRAAGAGLADAAFRDRFLIRVRFVAAHGLTLPADLCACAGTGPQKTDAKTRAEHGGQPAAPPGQARPRRPDTPCGPAARSLVDDHTIGPCVRYRL